MRRRTKIILGTLVAVIVVASIAIVVSVRSLEPRLHKWVTDTLRDSLESEIQLGEVRLSWMPLRLHARDLIVRHHGRVDVPPLLVVSSFTLDLRPTDLWSSRVERVTVDGLEVNIPPRDPETGKRPFPKPGKGDDDNADRSDDGGNGLVIQHLIARNARMAIVPREQGKNAKVWDIFELDMKNLRADEPAPFTAALINPIPYGRIESSGTFGPWQSVDPGSSAITGEYTFAADLGTIVGLGGEVNATGTMGGTIEKISTQGETHTPAFRLTELDGRSLPLNTSYDAVVDGTKGDVDLNRVDIVLGKSKLSARGVVEGTKGIKGKRVVVNVKSKSADLGELLQFVSKAGPPPADGVLSIDAALDLPQGKEPVLDRLALEGSVSANRVKFANDTVQAKIDELSRRGQGRPSDASIEEVASSMSAKFSLKKGVMTYRGLSFNVEGAKIQMAGTHSLKSKAVDMSGVVLLNATVSRTMTGYRSWLLRPFDPLFRKNGAGTRLVITVAGTQDQPKVGLDIGRTLKGK